jgi:CPA2 family monovalent cation:H+ antiporter-2
MVALADGVRPDSPVLARASDSKLALSLIRLGAADETPEAVEASLQLGARLLKSLGVPDDAIARRIEEMRGQELARTAEADGKT